MSSRFAQVPTRTAAVLVGTGLLWTVIAWIFIPPQLQRAGGPLVVALFLPTVLTYVLLALPLTAIGVLLAAINIRADLVWYALVAMWGATAAQVVLIDLGPAPKEDPDMAVVLGLFGAAAVTLVVAYGAWARRRARFVVGLVLPLGTAAVVAVLSLLLAAF